MIEATYVLTIDDLMEAGKEAIAGDRAILRFRAQWLAVGIGLIAIVFIQKPSPLYWLLLLALLFIWIAIAHPGQFLKAHFQKSVTNEEVVVHIDQSGVRMESPTSRCEIKWSGFKKMHETSGTLSLITITNTFIVLPKRAFTEKASEEFLKLAAQNGIRFAPR